MYQLRTCIASLTLFFSTFSAMVLAVESVQLDVYHGDVQKAEHIISAWDKIIADSSEERRIKLQAVLVPESEQDQRIFVVWTGVQRNLPVSIAMAKLQEFHKPDFSLALQPTEFSTSNWSNLRNGEAVELRTYITTPGNLTAIHHRFRDHTMKLFERHGMKNIAYFRLLKDERASVGEILKNLSPLGQDAINAADASLSSADHTLIYFLSHKSSAAGLASFTTFRADPEWIKAKSASEEQAGGSLTVGNGVKSLYLRQIVLSTAKAE